MRIKQTLNRQAFEHVRDSAQYAREVTSPGLMLAVAGLKKIIADDQATGQMRALARLAALRLAEAAVLIDSLEEAALDDLTTADPDNADR